MKERAAPGQRARSEPGRHRPAGVRGRPAEPGRHGLGARHRQALWTAVNERDELGDELVPDYITSVKDGGVLRLAVLVLRAATKTRAQGRAARPRAEGHRARPRPRLRTPRRSVSASTRPRRSPRSTAAGPSSASVGRGTARSSPATGWRSCRSKDGKPAGPPRGLPDRLHQGTTTKSTAGRLRVRRGDGALLVTDRRAATDCISSFRPGEEITIRRGRAAPARALHADRVAGRDRHHRGLDRAAAAGRAKSPRGGGPACRARTTSSRSASRCTTYHAAVGRLPPGPRDADARHLLAHAVPAAVPGAGRSRRADRLRRPAGRLHRPPGHSLRRLAQPARPRACRAGRFVCPVDPAGGRVPGFAYGGTNYAANAGSGAALRQPGRRRWRLLPRLRGRPRRHLRRHFEHGRVLRTPARRRNRHRPGRPDRALRHPPVAGDADHAGRRQPSAGDWNSERGGKWIVGNYGNTLYNHAGRRTRPRPTA